jgi:hypothetical protein
LDSLQYSLPPITLPRQARDVVRGHKAKKAPVTIARAEAQFISLPDEHSSDSMHWSNKGRPMKAALKDDAFGWLCSILMLETAEVG